MAGSDEVFKQHWAKIIAKCWNDENYKQRFLKDPYSVFKEEGVDIPEGIKIDIHQNDDKTINYILP